MNKKEDFQIETEKLRKAYAIVQNRISLSKDLKYDILADLTSRIQRKTSKRKKYFCMLMQELNELIKSISEERLAGHSSIRLSMFTCRQHSIEIELENERNMQRRSHAVDDSSKVYNAKLLNNILETSYKAFEYNECKIREAELLKEELIDIINIKSLTK